MQAKMTKDIRDESGDTDLYVPTGTIIDVERDDDGWIGRGNGWSFPIFDDEFEIIDLPRLATSPFTVSQLRAAGEQSDTIRLNPLD
jgi:hypothetical protein